MPKNAELVVANTVFLAVPLTLHTHSSVDLLYVLCLCACVRLLLFPTQDVVYGGHLPSQYPVRRNYLSGNPVRRKQCSWRKLVRTRGKYEYRKTARTTNIVSPKEF